MSIRFSELTRPVMSEVKPPNVRKCLFGRPDREKLLKDIEKSEKLFQEEDTKRFRETWGFDPITGPISGGPFDYKVISVDSSEEIPAFYSKGYSTRKSRPARTIRELHSFNRPTSAKRKLDLNNENDENEIFSNRVPDMRNIVNDSQLLHHLSSANCPTSGEVITCSCLFDSQDELARSSSTSVMSSTRSHDIQTPESVSLVQKTMKDYMPNKKQRMLNTKALPRT